MGLQPYFFFFLRILALEKLGAVFNQVATPLRYTPRKFVIHPQSSNLVIIESDHNSFTDTVKEEKKQQIAEVCSKASLVLSKQSAYEPARVAFNNEVCWILSFFVQFWFVLATALVGSEHCDSTLIEEFDG